MDGTLKTPALVFQPIASRPAPVRMEGPLAWIRTNLFGDWKTTVGTVVILGVLAWLLPYLVGRGRGQGRLDAIWVRLVVAVLAVGLAGVSSLQVYRIGDSGARAAWSGNVCSVPYENCTCPNNQFLH